MAYGGWNEVLASSMEGMLVNKLHTKHSIIVYFDWASVVLGCAEQFIQSIHIPLQCKNVILSVFGRNNGRIVVGILSHSVACHANAILLELGIVVRKTKQKYLPGYDFLRINPTIKECEEFYT